MKIVFLIMFALGLLKAELVTEFGYPVRIISANSDDFTLIDKYEDVTITVIDTTIYESIVNELNGTKIYLNNINFSVNPDTNIATIVDFNRSNIQIYYDDSFFPVVIADANIILRNPGIIYDTLTGLTWQNDETLKYSLSWENAVKKCETSLIAGFYDWRLPNVNELASIVEREVDNSSFNIKENILKHNDKAFWSSTSGFSGHEDAWYITKDYIEKNSKAARYNVRCVRDSGTIYIK